MNINEWFLFALFSVTMVTISDTYAIFHVITIFDSSIGDSRLLHDELCVNSCTIAECYIPE